MKIKLFSFTVVFVLLLSGCANNLDTPELDKQKTVKAYFADGDTTKSTAVIDGDKASFMWASGDQISLVADGKNVIANNSLQEGASASSTDFTYNSEEFTFESGDIAIYPYNAAHTAETVELPSVYNLGNNTDNTNAIMYAEYDGNALSFRHLAGMLRFDIKNLPIETAKIVVTTDKGITGNFTIKESDGKKVIETVESKDGNNTVTINFTELTSKSDSKLFYIPLPVGTYQSIQVDIYDTDGCKTMASKVNVKNRDIVRAQMVRFGYTPEELPVKIGGRGYESLAVALEATKDKSNVDIELIGDVDLDISSSVITYGSSSPQTITIEGNNKKITFNHKNSDWNYIRLANDDSKWIIKNAVLTNVEHNNGPQGRHNIRFYNEVELNQIVSDKAISLLNDAILENVTISDTHISNSEAYALWISAEGQTVTLKNCHFYPSENKTGDRAIKIADEYIDVKQQKKVTLNISGCDFDSQKKAAVVVTSTAGADIVWGDGNNIEGVNMDKIHAVWVDEVRAQYYSDVNVTGCSKTLEGVSKEIESEKVSYTFNASAATEVKKYGLLAIMSDIELLDKDIAILNIPSGLCMEWETGAAIGSTPFLGENCKSNLTIKGEGTLKATGSGVGPIHIKNSNKKLSFEGITIKDESVSYAESAWEYTYLEIGSKDGNISFKDVTFGDEICASDGTFSFTGCSFESNESSRYAVWISAPYVTFEDCIVTGKRGFKAHEAYGSDISSLNIDACYFLNLEEKPGIAIGDVNETTSINISNCKFINCQPGDQSLYSYETDTPITSFNFTFTNNITADKMISTADELREFADDVNNNGISYSGKTVILNDNIDLNNSDWEPIGQTTTGKQFKGVFNGLNYMISNLNVDSYGETSGSYSSGLFGWLNGATVKNLKVNAATIKGNHNVGVIAGYMETSGCTIDNCHVTNSTLDCKNANEHANGDKAGVIVGYAGNDGTIVKSCTADSCNLTAGRDAGQIVGAAKEINVTDCSATSVSVTSNGTGTGNNIRNELIGRIL